MRRILIAIGTTLTGLVLLLSFPTSLNRTASAGAAGATGAAGTAPAGTTPAESSTADAAPAPPVTVDGAVAPTRFGDVQVRITVANGVVTASDAIAAPGGDRKNLKITAYAVPILNQEAVAASSANIAMVSGATYTSAGYIQSLQSALDQAGL